MSEDLIRYDILTQNALRTMIANLLEEVARTGLPGEHHFFITFDTCASGVQLSKRMHEKYPEEMTIVVQHRFWELKVKPDWFQIGLSFDEIPEILVIPFAAVKGFYDPSVKFGLQFEVQPQDATDVEPAPKPVPKPSLVKNTPEPVKTKPGPKKKRKSTAGKKARPELFEDAAPDSASDKTPSKKPTKPDKNKDDADTPGAQVVSLDSFRKKK